VLTKTVGALSKGYRRRLLLAVGLLAPQPLLAMDEPFDGLDLRQTREVMGLLRRVAEGGRALLLSIHQLTDAERVCDRFVLLAAGRVRGEGTLAELRAEALSERSDRKVTIRVPKRGDHVRMIRQASRNAEEELDRHLAETSTQAKTMRALTEVLELAEPPQRIEVYDNSHVMGTNAVGAMIVAGPEGFRKNAYRKFNIKRPETAPGDDFAMMREVLGRRFARLEKEDPDRSRGEWPDLLLIDGGKGQLSAVLETLECAGIHDVPVVGVSKGPDRNAGRETLHLANGRDFQLPPNSAVLFYIQRLRDEAHRFAIGAHRQKRAKSMTASPLDEVPGIGPSRKRALLMHFGTAKAVRGAALEDLEKAPGISRTMARGIYDYFHPSG